MATADRPLPTTSRPELATTVVRPPKPFFLRSWFAIVLVVGLIAAHVWGWYEAEIRPELLVQKAPEMQRFFGEVLKPDVLTTDVAEIQIQAPVGGSATPVGNAPPVEVSEGLVPTLWQGNQQLIQEGLEQTDTYNATLRVSAGTVSPGQQVTVSGEGFRPNAKGKVLWQSAGVSAAVQAIGEFTADASGNFTTQVRVPDDPERVISASGFPSTLAVSQEWPASGLKLSNTFWTVIEKVIETIFLALMGTTFAVILSIPLSFLASHNLMAHNLLGTGVYYVARTILNILRSIEVLILAVIFGATIGIGPFAGVLALTLHSIASLGKLYSEAIESIDPGPIEAITATGANRLQVITYAVVPQFIPQFISFTLYRWDINVRMSTVIGFVGGGGIGFILQQYISNLNWNSAATAIWAIAIVVIVMDFASARIRAAVI